MSEVEIGTELHVTNPDPNVERSDRFPFCEGDVWEFIPPTP